MFCPDCETEYRDGIERCSDCSALLVESLEADPGEAQLVPLTEESGSGLVGELVDRLEKAGVPYVIQAGTALSLLDRDRRNIRAGAVERADLCRRGRARGPRAANPGAGAVGVTRL